MRVTLIGSLGAGVTAKDVALALMGRLGVGGGSGFALEFADRSSAACRWNSG